MKCAMAELLLALLVVSTAPATARAAEPAADKANPNHWNATVPTTRTTADGRPLASSLPPRGGQARNQAKTLAFAELPGHVGERLEITTIFGDRYAGQLESVTGRTLRLRQSRGLGYAITNFEQDKVRLIRDMD
jgi:hypothetical protein